MTKKLRRKLCDRPGIIFAAEGAYRSGDRYNFQFTCLHCVNAAHFTAAQGLHGVGRIENMFSAVQAYFVCLLLECEWTCQTLMSATKENFVQKVENGLQNFHGWPLSIVIVSRRIRPFHHQMLCNRLDAFSSCAAQRSPYSMVTAGVITIYGSRAFRNALRIACAAALAEPDRT